MRSPVIAYSLFAAAVVGPSLVVGAPPSSPKPEAPGMAPLAEGRATAAPAVAAKQVARSPMDAQMLKRKDDDDNNTRGDPAERVCEGIYGIWKEDNCLLKHGVIPRVGVNPLGTKFAPTPPTP